MELKFLKFNVKNDTRGSLAFLEAGREVPFDIKRIYYIYGAGADVERGFHAHKELEQCLICMNGSVEIELDDGSEKAVCVLNDRTKGLYVGSGIWRIMRRFSSDAVLMVLASEYYDESDYIRDYDLFLTSRQK